MRNARKKAKHARRVNQAADQRHCRQAKDAQDAQPVAQADTLGQIGNSDAVAAFQRLDQLLGGALPDAPVGDPDASIEWLGACWNVCADFIEQQQAEINQYLQQYSFAVETA